MASYMIHICVANEINKKLKRNPKKILLGSIAPDLAKEIQIRRSITHFSGDDGIPNLDKFLEKYRFRLSDDFVLGYYIHLYTDYLWSKYFISDFTTKNTITTLDGEQVHLSNKELKEIVYQDYTNLNIQLTDLYNLDCSLYYEDLPEISPIIEEIDYQELHKIVEKADQMIQNTEEKESYLFNIEDIQQFIEMSVCIIESNLKELNILE